MACTEFAPNAWICREEMHEVTRKPHGDQRWCFQCRDRVPFEFIVTAPVGPSYYEPNPSIECGPRGHIDGDMFPGRWREWGGGF